ncbi:hypothetical protein K9L97_01890 [Candidatus Woesearchaeota archaeon]|nr:hypothetical protein [Candidatus Woesearchaeota archaeon]
MRQEIAKQIHAIKEYFAKGKRGYIYISQYKDKKYIIKEKNPDSTAEGTIENESRSNKELNKIGIGPKFYYKDPNNKYLIREYVEGTDIYDLIKENKDSNIKKKLKKIILNILEQTRKLDETGINKLELTRPHKDILITKKNNPVMIDFERCKQTEKPKNVNQFCQFIANGKFYFKLKELGIKINSEKLLKLATEYKQNNYDKNKFKEIKKYLKDV